MFQLMLQKLLHKKWMMVSLLIGIILLVAVAVSHTMYQDASLAWMLEHDFDTYVEEKNENPGLITITGRVTKNSTETEEFEEAEVLSKEVCQSLDLVQTNEVRFDTLERTTVVSRITKPDKTPESKISISHMSDLKEHVKVISGDLYGDGFSEDGCIEAVVTLKAAIDRDYLVGEILDFKYMTDPSGNPYRVKIVGVVNWADSSDPYWVYSPDTYIKDVFVAPDVFSAVFNHVVGGYERKTDWYITYDYSVLDHKNAKSLIEKTYRMMNVYSKNGVVFNRPAYMDILENFMDSKQKITTTLTILQVPMLALLCAFLFMISRQMYTSEQSEIALLRSRGASKSQIFSLYLLQAITLSLVGLVIGLPIGNLLCRAIGSSGAFLEFTERRSLQVRVTAEVMIYALAAVLVSIAMMVLPAALGKDSSIVEQKRKRARSKKPIWQKLGLDLVALGVSLYGYYSFSRQKDVLRAAVVAGESLDPLLYLSSSLFILGASLLVLRIWPYLVKLIYLIGKKRWKPASYAAFLELQRTGSRLYFIQAFLMLTVAMGCFSTCVARTIETNANTNVSYHVGADLAMQERWPDNSTQRRFDNTLPLIYTEPDYGKYDLLEGVASKTQVFVDRYAMLPKHTKLTLTLYGIHTKTFGETTSLPADCMQEHYYTYLNAMAENPNYILCSATFRDILGYKVGDSLSYKTEDKSIMKGVIAGFVEYFPGFTPQKIVLNPDGTSAIQYNYLVVANLSSLQQEWGVIPYQIWFRMQDGVSTDGFYRFVEENNIPIARYKDRTTELANIRKDTVFQGTNGILTMSFIIVLLLSGIGYLIYWILSIKSRELLFGVLRAMGLGKGSVAFMLSIEQFFASILPVFAGAGVGILASNLYVPLIQIAYSASDQVLPMELVLNASDLLELFGMIGLMLLICFILLARQVLTSKIAQALKLGED